MVEMETPVVKLHKLLRVETLTCRRYSPLVSRWREERFPPVRSVAQLLRKNATHVALLVRSSVTPNLIEAHETHLVRFPHTGNRSPTKLLPGPSIDDIRAIAELETKADAIMIATEEIAYLDNLSLEDDIPDDVSDIVEVQKNTLFLAS